MPTNNIIVRRNADGSLESLRLSTGRVHEIEIPSGVAVVHLTGPAFALEKCFLLPAATTAIGRLRTIFGENPGAEVLVVGHTDASGSTSYNRDLSLGRARAIAAYLTDDVDVWLDFFDDPPAGEPWGIQEIVQMLSVLPHGAPQPFFSGSRSSADAIRAFQEAEGLDPDGHADEDVRAKLVARYMALDGTSLPAGTRVSVHGCGESHPLGGPTERDRRVDIFLFHPEIEPRPTDETSTAEYPEWVASATRVHDLGVQDDPTQHLELRLHDADRHPMPQAPFRITMGNGPPVHGVSDDDGFVFIRLPPVCPEAIHVEWGAHPVFEFEYELDVFAACSPENPRSRAIVRLNNLGYASTIDLDAAVRQFQLDYGVDDEPILGLVDDELPPQSMAKLDEIFAEKQSNATFQS